MTFSTIILAAAKATKVSGTLLLAICSHESHLVNQVVPFDHGSPSIGVCQVKYKTAQMLGFKGKPEDLMDVKTNATWAGKYLKYQENRYGSDDWCKLAAAYNAGSFLESKKEPGKPKNLKYVRLVQKQLDTSFQYKLSCDGTEFTENQ